MVGADGDQMPSASPIGIAPGLGVAAGVPRDVVPTDVFPEPAGSTAASSRSLRRARPAGRKITVAAR